MKFATRAVALGFALLLCCAGSAQTAAPGSSPDPAMDQVVHDTCGKRIVLLGEPPVHGFGKVLDFKAALTRRLIAKCHFNGFFIESGIYDFLNIEKLETSGKTVTAKTIQAAIGGIWANQEVERLIPELLHGVNSGKLTLGGLDDQLSRGTYAQSEMPRDLAQYLKGDSKDRCLSALERHTQWQYSSAAPYGPDDKARLIGCLNQIEAQIDAQIQSGAAKLHAAGAARDFQMAVSLKKFLSRDFPEPAANGDADTQSSNDRDRSMYQNFEWLYSRMPAHRKIIVWTATSHAAKDLSVVPDERRISMGSFLHRDFGKKAFALGSSEYSGSYAFGSRPARQLTAAPENSLEARAFRENQLTARYFDVHQLRKLGRIAARPLGIDFKTAQWNQVFDGLVVFREEHPPTPSVR